MIKIQSRIETSIAAFPLEFNPWIDLLRDAFVMRPSHRLLINVEKEKHKQAIREPVEIRVKPGNGVEKIFA